MNGHAEIRWWASLRHAGLLLSPREVTALHAGHPVAPLPAHRAESLRRELQRFAAGELPAGELVGFVLSQVCGLAGEGWLTGPALGTAYTHTLVSGASLRPRRVWVSPEGGLLPVFVDESKALGQGRGRRTVAEVVQWLRAARRPVALLTNARQWRLLYAGLDFEASCESDSEQWFEGGEPGPQLEALRRLLQPALHTPAAKGEIPPLLAAILASRQGQSELSAALGERVREAVELLLRAHGEALSASDLTAHPAEVYRAAVRLVMRLVVLLFAESRDLLPRANPTYQGAYGLQGLFESLERAAARGRGRLEHRHAAWPRLLALFRLLHAGSGHEALPVPAYGGELFAPGDTAAADPLSRALALFESACFDPARPPISDAVVHAMLHLLTRSQVRVRQGRATTTTVVPVDFSDLSSEYLGILYEGLLDYELRRAPADDPIVFLAVGDEPALPLARLEAMADADIASLFEKLKQKKGAAEGGEGEDEAEAESEAEAEEVPEEEGEEEAVEPEEEAPEAAGEIAEDVAAGGEGSSRSPAEAARSRALAWTRRAAVAGGLVSRPRGKLTADRELAFAREVEKKAKQLVRRVVLPGEWFLVRWGGTRKGSGTFYTRPQLAVPLAWRTLRPLAYEAPEAAPAGEPAAEPARPRPPEAILALQVCDPACGSGSFLVAALRFLTEAVWESLFAHGRLAEPDRPLDELLGLAAPGAAEGASAVHLPCRPDEPDFEPRTKALLRRYVVERCLYGVDLDPLAAELCRLALWIETMDRDLPFSFLDHKVKCGNSLVGAWFDRAPHYPAMAWAREAGDEKHDRGVHFRKGERAAALKGFRERELKPALVRHLSGQKALFDEDAQADAHAAHDAATERLARLHDLPVAEAAERARRYREEILEDPALARLRDAFDLWCACWFWPADEVAAAPLPSDLAGPRPETLAVSRRLARAKRFFHWELEFPEAFTRAKRGFDALLGNPPWEVAKPNSKEFFSNHDPLYRAYGKQEALRRQVELFAEAAVEREWLEYAADYRAQSNFMGGAARPFGDPAAATSSSERFGLSRKAAENKRLHERWREARAQSGGFADPVHPFRHQGSGDVNLYKLFLEQAHALLRPGGRLGFLVPSGLYSDHGSQALRRLFLDHCRWEWLFGFENREKVFDIDSRFKFNPVIVEKGGTTAAIRTAFMRRQLDDWARAEELATDYPRERVAQFSPRSAAILEIQSKRDLEILEKIYANSVLLGDDGPDGWGIRYATEFHMTNDSKLFPPRPWWESQGYRPDEYSRWLKGNWRPRAPGTPAPPDARRVDLPAGVILSRDRSEWIREEEIEDTALPLYEGRMIGQFDFSQKGWVSGKGRSAVWREIPWGEKRIEPQYLMGFATYQEEAIARHLKRVKRIAGVEGALAERDRLREPAAFAQWWLSRWARVAFLDVTSATNERTMIAAPAGQLPCGNSVPTLTLAADSLALVAILNSFVHDFVERARCSGLHLNYFVIEEAALLEPTGRLHLADLAAGLSLGLAQHAPLLLRRVAASQGPGAVVQYMTGRERLAARIRADTICLSAFGVASDEARHLLSGCDHPADAVRSDDFTARLDPKGFWRVDKERDPELRHTVLTLVALHDLEASIREQGGDREKGIAAFCAQNGGEGWMLPETLCLADYGLGHDDRANRRQPVASRLGPRFYDWQLAQDPEEPWRECHLHARNLLGETGYAELLSEVERDATAAGGEEAGFGVRRDEPLGSADAQGSLFPVKAEP